jgi:hypothetical protein
MDSYTRELEVKAAPERLFDAIATLDGLRGWWTRLVTGSGEAGWEHFLGSLVALVERGRGAPFRAGGRRA